MSVEIQVFDAKGAKARTQELSADTFGGKIHASALHQVVRWQRSARRAGTHKVKTRAEMTGGGAKPWKQKGTGRARAGSNTSPLWVGGGVAHGPTPRSYEFRMNRQEKRLALRSAVSARIQEGQAFVLESLGLKEIKTSQAVKLLSKLGINVGKDSVLLVLPEANEVEAKSLRNIPKLTTVLPQGVNVFDVMNAKFVVFLGDSLKAVEERVQA